MSPTIAEMIMFSTLQITKLDANQREIGAATGFAVAFCAKGNSFAPTLVTNRHVLSNCAYIQLVFTLKKQDGTPDVGKTTTVNIGTESAIFHPNNSIDLAVLPLGPTIAQLKSQGLFPFCPCVGLEQIPPKEKWSSFDAIEKVVTAGYPEGLRDTINNLPIIRSGITATHPAYDYQGRPEFLVDVPCFKGCSGSAVYSLERDRPLEWGKIEDCNDNLAFYLLGIQHSMQVVSVTGSLENAPENLANAKPVFQLPMNLGIIVKSTELLAFEPILDKLINQPSTDQIT